MKFQSISLRDEKFIPEKDPSKTGPSPVKEIKTPNFPPKDKISPNFDQLLKKSPKSDRQMGVTPRPCRARLVKYLHASATIQN